MCSNNSSGYTYKYPRPALTVDCIVFHKEIDEQSIRVLLIERGTSPFKGKWAFPGGFVDIGEELIDAAQRELFEETGLKDVELFQFKTFGNVGRDPRGRTISVVYHGITTGEIPLVVGDDDAASAAWFKLDDLPELAFDHNYILNELRQFLNI